jgi:hypothetical protein
VIQATLAIRSTSPSYADKDYFKLVVQPVFVDHTANNVRTTVTSVGRLGFALELGGNGSDGIGFIFRSGPNVLFEGAMLVGVSPTQVSDAARGTARPGFPIQVEDDFQPLPDGVPHLLTGATLADQQTVAHFQDSRAVPQLGVQLRQETFQFAEAPDDDYVILRYRIRNVSATALSNLYVGWYNDWDIGGVGSENPADNDRTGFDPGRGLGYAWDQNGGAFGAYFGIMVLTAPGAASYRGIWNDDTDPRNPSFGLYDGYTKDEKWQTLSGGVVFTDAGPADISNAIATGPFTLAPQDSVLVAFAYLAGDDLADLQANADAAAARWQRLEPLLPVEIFDLGAVQEGGDVLVRWRTAEERRVAAFRVYRARDGGALEPLAPDVAPRAEQSYSFRDPSPGPGRYVYRVAEVSPEGDVVLHGGAAVEVTAAVPVRHFLGPNVPNPFNPATLLRYGLAAAGPVRLDIFDGRGRLVRSLVRRPYVAAGFYTATWDGRDDGGRPVASGVYHARLQLVDRALHWRLTLLH